jgi:hypothetical protein
VLFSPKALQIMKRLQTVSVYLAVFVLAGVSSLKSDEPVKTQSRAMARTVKGRATYTTPDGTTKRLKANAELAPGTTIITGPGSFAYLSVNGLSSAVRLDAKTTVVIERMERTGPAREGTTETRLNLKVGSIFGQIKKVAGDSTFEIETPHGVAGIRGTDFAIDVAPSSDGKFSATFTCVTGQVIVAALVDSFLQTKTIHEGECWTPGSGGPQMAPPERLQSYAQWQIPLGRAVAPPEITILPVFPNGAPPLGPSGPPRK